MPILVWDTYPCPNDGTEVPMKIMSLCCTCPKCGAFYVNDLEGRGWYASSAAYYRGEEPLPFKAPATIPVEGQGKPSTDST